MMKIIQRTYGFDDSWTRAKHASGDAPKKSNRSTPKRSLVFKILFPENTLALGDWVELWAKPIGRVIDWITAKAPKWMVHPANPPGAWVVVSKHPIFKRPWWDIRLSNKWRTGFAKGACGCQKRKAQPTSIKG